MDVIECGALLRGDLRKRLRTAAIRRNRPEFSAWILHGEGGSFIVFHQQRFVNLKTIHVGWLA
jgi:hypothetical protein